MLRSLLLFGLPVLAAAQGLVPRITPPTLGYVFDDNAKAIRLVSGIPGAANLDLTVRLDAAIESAFVHSRARLALVNTKDKRVALADWNSEPHLTLLDTSLEQATTASFSRRGDQVAIGAGSTVELWSDLRSTPTRTSTFTVEDGVATLALSADGTLAASTRSGRLLLLGEENRTISTGISGGGLVFLSNGNDLVAADAIARTLLVIRNVRSAPASSVVTNLDEEPKAIAVSTEGDWAALAFAGDVAAVNLNDGARKELHCRCQVGSFDALEGRLVLHATDTVTGAAFVLDLDQAEPQAGILAELGGAAQ